MDVQTNSRQNARKAYVQRKGRVGAWLFIGMAFVLIIDLLAVQGLAGPARPVAEIVGVILACCLGLLVSGLTGYVLGLIYGLIMWNPQEHRRI